MISFVTSIYNCNKYLDAFFESFIGIPCEYEIVAMDDRGSEDPRQIIEKWSKKLNIVSKRNKVNLGAGFSRNEALKYVSKESNHIIYIDSDDILYGFDFLTDIEEGKITSFEVIDFDKKGENNIWKRNKYFGKNLYPNTIWGISIPTEIAKKYLFESRTYEDGIVNRRLIRDHKEDFILSDRICIKYRRRGSSIMGSGITPEKFEVFVSEFSKLIKEKHNTNRFNIQEIYQYYWMWKKDLKGFNRNELPKTKMMYRIAFCLTGSAIRFLHLEKLIYGTKNKNAFD